jgi:hypothetical protein
MHTSMYSGMRICLQWHVDYSCNYIYECFIDFKECIYNFILMGMKYLNAYFSSKCRNNILVMEDFELCVLKYVSRIFIYVRYICTYTYVCIYIYSTFYLNCTSGDERVTSLFNHSITE